MSICSEQDSRPTDQPASDLDYGTSAGTITDQSSVNRAILISLDHLNQNLATLTQQYEEEYMLNHSLH